LGPENAGAIAERLEQRFDLLEGAQTSMTPRQPDPARPRRLVVRTSRSGRAAFVGRLGIFAGAFGLDAVGGVCADEDLSAAQAATLLANLVDKSMGVRAGVVRSDRGGRAPHCTEQTVPGRRHGGRVPYRESR
jgi:hypothetical protein